MTEKRFVGEEDSDYIRDNKTDERALYLCDQLNKLNNLSEENEQLKQENKKFKRIIDKLELERCKYLNDKQARSKWGDNYD